MNNLQPLKWQRIDTAKLSGIYCQKTDSYIEDAVSFCSTLVAEYVIRKDKENGKYSANYGGRQENRYDTIDEAEHWAEHTHYASKMQPYVKPSPTWIDAKKQLPQVDVDTQFICAYYSAIEPYVKTTYFDTSLNKFDYEHGSVLAWMPIPEFSTMQNLHKTIV